jgi:hypothetical protein
MESVVQKKCKALSEKCDMILKAPARLGLSFNLRVSAGTEPGGKWRR